MNKITNNDDVEILKKQITEILNGFSIPTRHTKVEDGFWRILEHKSLDKRFPIVVPVYFLLVYLLGYEDLGPSEKTVWTIPIEYDKIVFLLELKKSGFYISSPNLKQKQPQLNYVIKQLAKASKAVLPFCDYIAENAIENSQLSIINNSRQLFERFDSFLQMYNEKMKMFKNEKEVFHKETGSWLLYDKNAQWLAIAAIEAFFSWTEHVFVLLAVFFNKVKNGKELVWLAKNSTWAEKYKKVFDLNNKKDKDFYDKLTNLRDEIRNYMAHGTFSKDARSIMFHTKMGAIPLNFKNESKTNISFNLEYMILNLIKEEQIMLLSHFVDFLWSDERELAKKYIQETSLSLNLQKALKCEYQKLILDTNKYEEYIDKEIYKKNALLNFDF